MPFIFRMNFCVAMAVPVIMAALGAAGAREFRVADTQAEDYPTVLALQFMARIVEERTAGRHRIRVFHSRQLGEEKDTIEQTRVGAIDLNRTNVAPIGSLVPAANVLAMPFLFRSFDHLHKVLDQAIGDEILASFERHGFVGLTFYDSGARSIYNSVRPVRCLADMKGLRIRVQQSELMFDMIKALGAEPVELPYGQVLTGLSTRLIDGAENNWPSYRDHQPLQARPLLHPYRAHDGPRSACDVAACLGKPLDRGPGDFSRRGAQIEHVHARDVERSGRALAAAGTRRREHHHRGLRPQAVRDRDGHDLCKDVTDPDLRQLIERIRQVQ